MATDQQLLRVLHDKCPSETTAKNYEGRFRALRGKKGFENASMHDVATRPAKYWPLVKAAYPNVNSRRAVVSAVLALYKYAPGLKEDHAREFEGWNKTHVDMTRLVHMDAQLNQMSQAQRQNHVSWQEIVAKLEEMRRAPDPHATRKTSMQFLLLQVLTDIKPKRADLGNLRIHYDRDPLAKTDNYIVLQRERNAGYLVLQRYKTSKQYHRFEEDFSQKTVRVIKDSLRRHPRHHLFVSIHGRPYERNNSYSSFVRNTFDQLFGRKLGVSLYRHVFLSEAVDVTNMTGEERAELARDMLHSTGQQTQYRFVTRSTQDNTCDCVCQPKTRASPA